MKINRHVMKWLELEFDILFIKPSFPNQLMRLSFAWRVTTHFSILTLKRPRSDFDSRRLASPEGYEDRESKLGDLALFGNQNSDSGVNSGPWASKDLGLAEFGAKTETEFQVWVAASGVRWLYIDASQ
jgi:hypothetical protein